MGEKNFLDMVYEWLYEHEDIECGHYLWLETMNEADLRSAVFNFLNQRAYRMGYPHVSCQFIGKATDKYIENMRSV